MRLIPSSAFVNLLACLMTLVVLTAPVQATSEETTPLRIEGFNAPGARDAVIAATPASLRAWMSYSAVAPSSRWPDKHGITTATRFAASDDGGASWQELGVTVNPVTTPTGDKAIDWNNDTAALAYDADAAPTERWKLFWHHYPLIEGQKRPAYGWIAYKAAAEPEQLAQAPERKFLAATGYDPQSGMGAPVAGSPRLTARRIDAKLETCLALSEPALLVKPAALYLALTCTTALAEEDNGVDAVKTVLLRCRKPCQPEADEAWHYVGDVLTPLDAGPLGYRGFAKPSLYSKNGKDYLTVSPLSGRPVKGAYNGCVVFRFDDIASGALSRNGELPEPVASIGRPTSFNGACTYQPALPAAGIVSHAIDLAAKPPRFTLLKQTGSFP